AQWHYPFENKHIFDNGYPADFISEGIDQTRGWFYTLHAIGTFLFDKPAYKNCLVNELILDKSGQKMSKSKGNTVNPFDIIEKYGADTTRWYLITNSPPWKPTLFDEEALGDVQRKFFGTLINTYAFFALYANIDKFDSSVPQTPLTERQEIDRWIISELNSLIKRYIASMDTYDVTKAAKFVSDFTTDQLSNWYVRRNRRRFWSKELPTDVSQAAKNKTAAYQTLYECLSTISKLIAPFAPFLAEELYKNLHSTSGNGSAESVHLVELPQPDESKIDLDLEERMKQAEAIVTLVRAIRNKSNIKIRQPLRRVILPISDDRRRHEVEMMESVILEEVNAKKIEYVHDDSEIVQKKTKPNFKALGPKHGKAVQPIANAIRSFGASEIRQLQANGHIMIPVNGTDVSVALEDVEIIHEDIKGWLVESDGILTVALDTELTPELIEEGFAREFINRVQNMRKDAGFEVMDRIKIFYGGTQPLAAALRTYEKYVMNETLATELRDSFQKGEFSVEDTINGEQCAIGIQR
ncbi:MAG: isoleucine--tRNA ligase, partial [Bacteroidetes bacterium]